MANTIKYKKKARIGFETEAETKEYIKKQGNISEWINQAIKEKREREDESGK